MKHTAALYDTGTPSVERLASVSLWLLREDFLSQPRAVQCETRARALRLARPGSALEKYVRRGVYDLEERHASS